MTIEFGADTLCRACRGRGTEHVRHAREGGSGFVRCACVCRRCAGSGLERRALALPPDLRARLVHECLALVRATAAARAVVVLDELTGDRPPSLPPKEIPRAD